MFIDFNLSEYNCTFNLCQVVIEKIRFKSQVKIRYAYGVEKEFAETTIYYRI